MASIELELNADAETYFAALPPEKQASIHRYLSVYVSAWLNQHKADADGLNGVDPEGAEWWASLTPEQQAEERAIVLRSIAEGDAGRTKPAEEVYARLRAKFAGKMETNNSLGEHLERARAQRDPVRLAENARRVGKLGGRPRGTTPTEEQRETMRQAQAARRERERADKKTKAREQQGGVLDV